MRLDLYSLRLFIAVVEHGTIAAAADQHAIATSALSKRISELERAVGSPLLIRKARWCGSDRRRPGADTRARVLIHNADNLEAELADFETGATGHVRIAANLSSIIQFLPEDLKRFSVAHPNVQISVEDRVSAQVTREVLDNSADIGIYFSRATNPSWKSSPTARTSWCWSRPMPIRWQPAQVLPSTKPWPSIT
jgi:DNA-binding transcriptional LysR family regulator